MEEKLRLNFKLSKLKILAVCFLILAGVIFYYEEFRQPEIQIETIDVIVASTDIPENEIITKDMIITEERYANDVMKNEEAITLQSNVIGKRTIVPIFKGEIINNRRIINNLSYMNGKEQTQTAIALAEVDRALNFKKGDYVDLWLQPILQLDDTTIVEPSKIFEKIQVIDIADSNYNRQKMNNAEGSIIESDLYIPTYITLELSDDSLKELYGIDKNQFKLRVTRYGEEKIYSVVGDILKEGEDNNKTNNSNKY